jgi:hypothetical protein
MVIDWFTAKKRLCMTVMLIKSNCNKFSFFLTWNNSSSSISIKIKNPFICWFTTDSYFSIPIFYSSIIIYFAS